MDSKLIDSYLLIEKAFAAGIIDEREIVQLLQEQAHHNFDGAVLALDSYYEHKRQIKDYIKKNNLLVETNPIQMGE